MKKPFRQNKTNDEVKKVSDRLKSLSAKKRTYLPISESVEPEPDPVGPLGRLKKVVKPIRR